MKPLPTLWHRADPDLTARVKRLEADVRVLAEEGETHWVHYQPTGDESPATSVTSSMWRRRSVSDVEQSTSPEFVWVKDNAEREAVVALATLLVQTLESDGGCAAALARAHLRLIEAVHRIVTP